MNWFKSIRNTNIYTFINFDIEAFYPNISPELFKEALEWSTQYIGMTEQQKKVVFQASKSFLYNKGEQSW